MYFISLSKRFCLLYFIFFGLQVLLAKKRDCITTLQVCEVLKFGI